MFENDKESQSSRLKTYAELLPELTTHKKEKAYTEKTSSSKKSLQESLKSKYVLLELQDSSGIDVYIPLNTDEGKKEKSIQELYKSWHLLYNQKKALYISLRKKKELSQAYLSSALKNKKRAELIKKRVVQFAHESATYDFALEEFVLFDYLDDYVSTHTAEIVFYNESGVGEGDNLLIAGFYFTDIRGNYLFLKGELTRE